MTWNLSHSTVVSGGPIAAVAAGATLIDGWVDNSGLIWDVNSSNFLESKNTTSPWDSGCLFRPTSENVQDAQIVARFSHAALRNKQVVFRHNGATSGVTAYLLGITTTGSQPSLKIYNIVNDAVTQLLTPVNVTLTEGTLYDLTCSVLQSGSSTVLTIQVATTTGTVLGSGAYTDSTSALQNVTGRLGIDVLTTSTTPASDFSQISAYTLPPATALTLSGPSSGYVGIPSNPFTVSTNGPIASAITVTPNDGGAGGAFAPTSVTLAAGSSSTATFTYTGAAAGSPSISLTNTGSLTNPVALTITEIVVVAVPVSSSAFKFSPGNWKGDTGRDGSVYRQTWNNGAYFIFTWLASASPLAVLQLPIASTGCMISYFLNNVITDNVAATANITISGVAPSAVNTLIVYARNSPQTNRWNNGANILQIRGIVLDSGSSPQTAPAANPWALIIGDSITEGYRAAGGSLDNNLYDYSYLVGQALANIGYDYCVSACSSSGWLRPGDTTADVPGYYVISGSSGGLGGTYNDAASRWNKIDQGVSLLDTNGQISAYGATGSQPSLIFINYMTNEALNSSTYNTSDSQSSVTHALTALRAAAPLAVIVVMMPFGLQYSPQYPQTYVTALSAGVAAYQAANPFDTRVSLINFGAGFATLINGTNYGNGIHPNQTGHALIAPKVAQAIFNALNAVNGQRAGPIRYLSHL